MNHIVKYIFIVFELVPAAAFAQTCGAFVGGYVPSWKNPALIDYTGLSHSFYAFAATNSNGDLVVDNPPALVAFKSAAASTKQFLSLAGGGGAQSYASMTSTPAAIQKFVDNCISFCKTNGFKGIDVDWEGIITTQDSVKYGSLMRALSSGLHTNGLQLVATLGFGSYGGDYYNVGALKQADWIQLMVYDQTGTWNESPYGGHATFQQVISAVAYWKNRGFTDVSKMVIGLPFYGYKFANYSGGLATAMTYSEIDRQYPNLSCDQDEVGLIVFNGPQTMRQKVEYVKQNGLLGVMIWEMSQDLADDNSRSLMRSIKLANCDQPSACIDVVTAVPEEINTERVFAANPVDKLLTVQFEGATDNISDVEVIDNLGRSFYHKNSEFKNTLEIDLSQQKTGVYYLRVLFKDEQRVVRRVLKI